MQRIAVTFSWQGTDEEPPRYMDSQYMYVAVPHTGDYVTDTDGSVRVAASVVWDLYPGDEEGPVVRVYLGEEV